MILTLDVGNTNIKTALFDGEEMKRYWRVSTNRATTSDEYGIIMSNLFAHAGLDTDCVDGIIMSSVVPSINFTLEHMCKQLLRPRADAGGARREDRHQHQVRQPARAGQRPHRQRRGRLHALRRPLHHHRLWHGHLASA